MTRQLRTSLAVRPWCQMLRVNCGLMPPVRRSRDVAGLAQNLAIRESVAPTQRLRVDVVKLGGRPGHGRSTPSDVSVALARALAPAP